MELSLTRHRAGKIPELLKRWLLGLFSSDKSWFAFDLIRTHLR